MRTRSKFTGAGGVIFTIVGLVGLTFMSSSHDTLTPMIAMFTLVFVAVLFIGMVVPTVAVRQVRATVVSPTDATVGDDLMVAITLQARAGEVVIRVLTPVSPTFRVQANETVNIKHKAIARGIFPAIEIEVISSAPLGLFEARHVMLVRMRQPVAVGPRPIKVNWKPAASPLDAAAELSRNGLQQGEQVRLTRPYVDGDPARLVHWPSTARSGDLVVKELEPPNPRGQAIVVDLTDLGEDTEAAASYAMGAVIAVLSEGGQVMLCTRDLSGPRSDLVTGRVAASRLLAGAVAGQPGAAPSGWPLVEIGR